MGLPRIAYRTQGHAHAARAKTRLGTAELREECAKFSSEFIEKQRSQFIRLGILAVGPTNIRTKNPAYEADILRTFAAFVERGLVYRSKKPVYWSIPCATALAEAEIEYKDHTSTSIWVPFKFDDVSAEKLGIPGAEIVIWTTTPWTLPSNLAMAVNPEFAYVAVEAGGRNFVVAESLADAFIADCKLESKDKTCRQGRRPQGACGLATVYKATKQGCLRALCDCDSGTGSRPYCAWTRVGRLSGRTGKRS